MRVLRLLLQSFARQLLFLPLVSLFFVSTAAASPCPTTVVDMIVRNTLEADKLAEALLCDGEGVFTVDWRGDILISRTFLVSNGSTLNVTGSSEDASAVVSGDDTVRLFEVDLGSTLLLETLTLTGGDQALSVYGGSYVDVTDCTFANNHNNGSGDGG